MVLFFCTFEEIHTVLKTNISHKPYHISVSCLPYPNPASVSDMSTLDAQKLKASLPFFS